MKVVSASIHQPRASPERGRIRSGADIACGEFGESILEAQIKNISLEACIDPAVLNESSNTDQRPLSLSYAIAAAAASTVGHVAEPKSLELPRSPLTHISKRIPARACALPGEVQSSCHTILLLCPLHG